MSTLASAVISSDWHGTSADLGESKYYDPTPVVQAQLANLQSMSDHYPFPQFTGSTAPDQRGPPVYESLPSSTVPTDVQSRPDDKSASAFQRAGQGTGPTNLTGNLPHSQLTSTHGAANLQTNIGDPDDAAQIHRNDNTNDQSTERQTRGDTDQNDAVSATLHAPYSLPMPIDELMDPDVVVAPAPPYEPKQTQTSQIPTNPSFGAAWAPSPPPPPYEAIQRANMFNTLPASTVVSQPNWINRLSSRATHLFGAVKRFPWKRKGEHSSPGSALPKSRAHVTSANSSWKSHVTDWDWWKSLAHRRRTSSLDAGDTVPPSVDAAPIASGRTTNARPRPYGYDYNRTRTTLGSGADHQDGQTRWKPYRPSYTINWSGPGSGARDRGGSLPGHTSSTTSNRSRLGSKASSLFKSARSWINRRLSRGAGERLKGDGAGGSRETNVSMTQPNVSNLGHEHPDTATFPMWDPRAVATGSHGHYWI